MGYRRSRARKQFEGDIRRILATISEAYSKECSSTAVREFALCSGVLLSSAKLESYIEDLLADWGSSIRLQRVATDKLPRRARAFLLNQPAIAAAYRKYVAEDDEESLLSKLESSIGQGHYDFAIDGRTLPAFRPEMLYADRKYPSPKNLRRLFKRFGVVDFFSEMNRLSKRDIEALLTSFNDLRTELGHVGMPVGQSVNDIKQRIRDIKLVVAYVDRMFYSKVRSTVGSNCWIS